MLYVASGFEVKCLYILWKIKRPTERRQKKVCSYIRKWLKKIIWLKLKLMKTELNV